jgi:hypothetical protein
MKPYVWGALFFVVALIVLGAVFAHMPTGPSLRPKPPVISNAGTGGLKPGSGGNGVPPDLVQIPKLATPPPISPAAPALAGAPPAGAPSLPSPLPAPVTPPPTR